MSRASLAVEPAARAPRRSQAERRTTTRLRLVDAAIDCLVELGAAGATTAEIEQRSGLSRGARLHHFPTKAALLAAAVDHLFHGLRESFDASIRAHIEHADTGAADRFDEAFRLLWANFEDPRYGAVLELKMVARTDAALRASLEAVVRAHHEHMGRSLAVYFPVAGDTRARLDPTRVMESIHAAMEGLALRRVVFGQDPTESEVLERVGEMARSWIRERVGTRPGGTHADDTE